MQLRFEMSGILDGSVLEPLIVELADVELPADERWALHETVDAVRRGDDAGLDPASLDPAERAQGVIYRLRVAEEATGGSIDGPVEVTYDDRTLPVDLLPLIELLRDRAIEERIARNRGES